MNASEIAYLTGNGSLNFPYYSLWLAFTKINKDYVTIFLSEGNHTYRDDSGSIIFKNDPLNTKSGKSLVIQGENPLKQSIIFWVGSMKITSNFSQVMFKNIIFDGSRILRSDCDGTSDFCYYCPNLIDTLENDEYTESLSEKELEYFSNNCSNFQDDILFIFYSPAYFENSQFFNFRHQFKNLILSYNSLVLTSVKFEGIQPRSNGLVINVHCSENCYNTQVELANVQIYKINMGYQPLYSFETGDFLNITGIKDIIFYNTSASFVFIKKIQSSIDSKYFIYVTNYNGTFIMNECDFNYLFVDNFIYIDNKMMVYENLDPDYLRISRSYNKDHLLIVDSKFYNILAKSGFIVYLLSRTVQNVRLSNLIFEELYLSQGLFYAAISEGFYNGFLYTQKISETYVPALRMNISDIDISGCKTNNYVIKILNFPYVNFTNVNMKDVINDYSLNNPMLLVTRILNYTRFSYWNLYSDNNDLSYLCDSVIESDSVVYFYGLNIILDTIDCFYDFDYATIQLTNSKFINIQGMQLLKVQRNFGNYGALKFLNAVNIL